MPGWTPSRWPAWSRPPCSRIWAGGADVTTTATIGPDRTDTGDLLVKEDGVVAGLLVAEIVFWQVGSGELTVAAGSLEGHQVVPGTVVLTVAGPTHRLLTAERVALNFVRHLSGVATLTRRFVDAVAGTSAVILDTRKTTPLLRALEKYAVRCGGGTNHRMSLSDMALIKDNHVLAAGGVRQAMERVRAAAAGVPIEIEVTSLAMAREAVDAGADRLLLDNMTPAQMAECVAAVGDRGGSRGQWRHHARLGAGDRRVRRGLHLGRGADALGAQSRRLARPSRLTRAPHR